jgi:hypothetical protein
MKSISPTPVMLESVLKVLTDFRCLPDEQRYSMATIDEQEKRLWPMIQRLDAQSGPGLAVGRLVAWPRGDGQAYYLVEEIRPRSVKLFHVPLGDAWIFPEVVRDGIANRKVVEEAIRQRDGLHSLFAKASPA